MELTKNRFLMLIICLAVLGTGGIGQDRNAALTKDEILLQLKQTSERGFSQGDIAAEVSRRGIAFPVDDETLQELRQAGARSFLIDAIRRAGEKPTQAGPSPEPVVAPERPRLRTADSPPPPAFEDLSPEARAEIIAKLPLLEQTRYHALLYAEELPDFRVTQIVKRYIQRPKDGEWELQDTLEGELSYQVKGGEKYDLKKLNGSPTKKNYEQLGGSTSTGEFGAILYSLFAPQTKAEFNEEGREDFNGRKSVIYDFRVKKAFSSSQITDKGTGRSVVAGFVGSVWIDIETKRVLRVELSHNDIQRGFPITLAETAIEYDWVDIAGERYLLPIRAEVLLGRDRDRHYSRNEIEFRDYHKFETDVKLVPESGPPN